jgi:Tripartite tricarboxylate transporter family receptor
MKGYAHTAIEMVHMPYRGSPPALTDLLAGQVQVMFDATPSSLPHIRAGKLRPLAATRTGAVYTAFPYPTKISPEAIALFIAAHTQPGDTVYQCPPPHLGDPQ